MDIADSVLASIPSGLRDELLHHYRVICSSYAEGRWEPAELNGGKFCEVVYTIAKGYLDGSYPDAASKPADFKKSCQQLEQVSKDENRIGDRSVRVLIPRQLVALYEIRNNRGVGHVGGDVSPNAMDSSFVLASTSWVMAELVRIFHGIEPAEAQGIVDSLVQRRLPLVWEGEDVRRVLDHKMTTDEQTLVLLYSVSGWCDVIDLVKCIEYSNASVYRKQRLKPMHKRRLIEFDETSDRVQILPPGVNRVEEEILADQGF